MLGGVAGAQGRLEVAAQLYEEGLAIARRSLGEYGSSLRSLRDLSVLLNRLGSVAQAQGRLDAAAQAYKEGLEIARRMLRDYGDTPQTIEDVALMLERLGDVLPADDVRRKPLYAEALALARRLHLAFRNDPREQAAESKVSRLTQKISA